MTGLLAGDPASLGPYRLLGRLGGGGMGQVYLGKSRGGRLVAVKMIRQEFAADQEFRVRFAREVANARNVSGMFTAVLADADTGGPVPWLATAYIPGPSLLDAVRESGPLPLATLQPLAVGLAEALAAIHAAGVVHRDLKPSNVLLAADGPRVIDFGISHAAEVTALTKPGIVMGSLGYMSPEQARGEKVGPQSDVFSLGAVLAFAASGQEPFGDGSPMTLMYRVINEAADLALVPSDLRPLIEWCLAKAPRDRPTPGELLAAWGGELFPANWLPETVAATLPRYEPSARVAALAAPPIRATHASWTRPLALPRRQPGSEAPMTNAAGAARKRASARGRHARPARRAPARWRVPILARARRRWPLAVAAAVALMVAPSAAAAITLAGGTPDRHPRAAASTPVVTATTGPALVRPSEGKPSTWVSTSEAHTQVPTTASLTPPSQPHSSPAAPPSQPVSSRSATTPAAMPTSPAPTAAATAPQPSAGPGSAGPLAATNAATHSCAAYPGDGFASTTSATFEWVNKTSNTVYVSSTDLGAVVETTAAIPPDSSLSAVQRLGGTYLVASPQGTCLGYVTLDGISGQVTIWS